MENEIFVAPPYTLLERITEELPVFRAIDPLSQKACVAKFACSNGLFSEEYADVLRARLEEEVNKLNRWSLCSNIVRLLDTRLCA